MVFFLTRLLGAQSNSPKLSAEITWLFKVTFSEITNPSIKLRESNAL